MGYAIAYPLMVGYAWVSGGCTDVRYLGASLEKPSFSGFGVARAQGSGLGALLRRWLAARRRTVRVNGQRARILGAIGAIETVVDVTDLKCSAGDPAVFDIDPLYARGFVREYR